MKHLLFYLLILIVLKGTESNHLNSKRSYPESEFKTVNYEFFDIGHYAIGNKLYLKIAKLLKEHHLFDDFSYKIKEDGKLEYRCESGRFAKTLTSSVTLKFEKLL